MMVILKLLHNILKQPHHLRFDDSWSEQCANFIEKCSILFFSFCSSMTITHWHLFPWSYSCCPGSGAHAARHAWGKEDGVPQQTAFSRTPWIRHTTRNGGTGILRADVTVKWLPELCKCHERADFDVRFEALKGWTYQSIWINVVCFCKVCERVVSSLEESLHGKGKKCVNVSLFLLLIISPWKKKKTA